MVSPGDTAWMLASAALVMLMIPGLALFYGGMVRAKNVLATMMQSFTCLGVVSVLWVLFGYSLAFGPDVMGMVGTLDWAGLRGVGMEPGPYSDRIPHLVFCAFQLMFAAITPALITGAFAERLKFIPFLVFTAAWTTAVYFPVCHWVWGGGWLGSMGALDFAGGTVIHINSGAAALAAAMITGQRRGYLKEPFYPNNLTLTMLGAGLLWYGWFGFNAGSALSSDGKAALALITTQTATAAASLGWIVCEGTLREKPTTLGFASGAIAGLVAITPAAGYVTPLYSLVIGFAAGVLCYFAILLKERFGFDDSLDVVGIHGVGGLWGATATGLFASVGAKGFISGNPHQLLVQLAGAGATMAYSFAMTCAILIVMGKLMNLRAEEDEEIQGLDLSEHGETGYYLR